MRIIRVIAFLLLPVAVRAQTVQGIVLDSATKRPIGGARLELLSDSGVAVARTVTDSGSGIFYLDAPRRGHYRVQIVVGRGGRVVSSAFGLDTNQVVEHEYAVPPLPPAMRDAYLPEDVTRRAAPKPRQMPPHYPDGPRSRCERGIVRALVVVDTTGRPDMATFLVLEATSGRFADAVRDGLRHFRYAPAELDGRRVAQVTPVDVDYGFNEDPVRLPAENGVDAMIIRSSGSCRQEAPSPDR